MPWIEVFLAFGGEFRDFTRTGSGVRSTPFHERPEPAYTPKEGDKVSGGRGKDWVSTSGKRPPKGQSQPYVVVKRKDGSTLLLTREEYDQSQR